MNPRATGWLLVITLALGAFVYFYEVASGPARQAAAEAGDRVFPDLVAEEIAALWIKRPGEVETRVERDETGWGLVAPLAFPADPTTVGAMVRAVSQMKADGRIDDPAAPEVYGLGDRAILVSFAAGRRSYGLRVGDGTPLAPSVYVRVVGGTDASGDADAASVLMVPSHVVQAFDRGSDDLRDRRVLGFEPRDVDRVEIESPTLIVTVERGTDGWQIERPARLPADPQAVERLLSDLSHLRADSFVDDPTPETEAALGAAATVIRLSGEAVGAELRLGLPDGSVDETLLARGRGGHAYRVKTRLVDHFPDRLFSLRAKRVARFDPAEANALELQFAAGGTVRLERAEGGASWIDADGRLASEALADLLRQVANLDAIDVVAESLGPEESRALGLDPPVVALRVDGESGRLAEVDVGAPDPAGRLARTPASEAVVRVGPGASLLIPSTLEDFDRDFLASVAEPDSESAPVAP